MIYLSFRGREPRALLSIETLKHCQRSEFVRIYAALIVAPRSVSTTLKDDLSPTHKRRLGGYNFDWKDSPTEMEAEKQGLKITTILLNTDDVAILLSGAFQ
ncbi:hypothetical protein TSMEX_000155 [Taenia solium]|eukprot:TsM_000265600 transcript=TsM_000265600 gene=TsM_000265600